MIQLYTDGGARGNPGPAAYGFLIYENNEELYSEGKKLGTTTNNVAEYKAIIEGLRRAKDLSDSVQVFSDSELIVKQLNGEYKVKKEHLKALYIQVKQLESHSGFTTSGSRLEREKGDAILADQIFQILIRYF